MAVLAVSGRLKVQYALVVLDHLVQHTLVVLVHSCQCMNLSTCCQLTTEPWPRICIAGKNCGQAGLNFQIQPVVGRW